MDNKRALWPGLWEKLSYGSGDFGFNLYWSTISAFLLIFYTDSFGLPAAAAGTMLLATKIVDAFVDPVVGAMADRTRSTWGRFRPWILFGALPLAVAGVLTFTTPGLEGQAKLIYAYATFTLMMVCYSVANIPYGALSGVLTRDPQARTQINSFRFVGGFLGSTFVTWATPKLVAFFGKNNEVIGWQVTMTLFGVLACLLFLNLFLATRERVQPKTERAENPLRDLSDLMRNRPWLIMFGLSMIVMVTISTRMGAAAYYVKYVLNRPADTGLFLTSYGASLAAGSLITPILTQYMDKRNLMIAAMVVVGVLCGAFWFIPTHETGLIYALNIAIGLALGPKSPLTFAMYADSADYNEYKTGRRATAMTFAAASFSQKLGGALASAVIGGVLAGLGYVANKVQSGASQTGILLLMSIVPAALAFLAAGLMLFYNLSDKRLAEMQAELADRKAD